MGQLTIILFSKFFYKALSIIQTLSAVIVEIRPKAEENLNLWETEDQISVLLTR